MVVDGVGIPGNPCRTGEVERRQLSATSVIGVVVCRARVSDVDEPAWLLSQQLCQPPTVGILTSEQLYCRIETR